MKKLVLSLAVLFAVGMVSCGESKTEAAADSTTCENTEAVQENTEAVEENTEATEGEEAPATDEAAAPAEEAPAAETTPAN